jgi:hypothetical protein
MTAASARTLLIALAAGLLALVPANASAGPPDPPVYVYSASSGELGGGSLTLHGVGRRITWATQGGRSGVTSIRRFHRLLFTPAKSPATATLHVAGQRGGEELVLRLSRPRYTAARRTVRYRVRRIKRGTAPRRRQFGAASLSIVAPQVPEGAATGNQCQTYVLNSSGAPLQLAAHSTPSDTWSTLPGVSVDPDVTVRWGSYGAAGKLLEHGHLQRPRATPGGLHHRDDVSREWHTDVHLHAFPPGEPAVLVRDGACARGRSGLVGA